MVKELPQEEFDALPERAQEYIANLKRELGYTEARYETASMQRDGMLEDHNEVALVCQGLRKELEGAKAEIADLKEENRIKDTRIRRLKLVLGSNEHMSKMYEAERDEADRRAGCAERRLASAKDTNFRAAQVRDKRKAALGYSRDTSFDLVWDDLLRANEALKTFAQFGKDALDQAGDVWTIGVENERIKVWFQQPDFKEARDAYIGELEGNS